MSFTDVSSFLRTTWRASAAAADNRQRPKWSTSGVSTMDDYWKIFDTKSDNDAFLVEYNKLVTEPATASIDKVQGLGLKVIEGARIKRDAHSQFPRSVDLDISRFKLASALFAALRQDWKDRITTKLLS